MKLVTVAEMREAEARAGVPVAQLMENAGLAVAQEVWLLLGEVADRRILVLVGPGNNGGDGLVAARHLHDWGAQVEVYLLRPRPDDDPVLAHVRQRDIPVCLAQDDAREGFRHLEEALGRAEVVIDAVLGTGRARPLEGEMAEVLDRLAAVRRRPYRPRLIALDLPSGVDADSGAADPHAVAADVTVTLQWSKVGLHQLPASTLVGRLEVVDIGIPRELEASFANELMDRRWARELLPPRPPGAHKGTFGRALVVAGSHRYVGAARLSALGALRVGAGLAVLACPRSVQPLVAAGMNEPTFLPLPDHDGQLSAEAVAPILQAVDQGADALLVGPGLGLGGYVQGMVGELLPALKARSLRAVVVDADALNNLAALPDWPSRLPPNCVLTPHPGEMSRLCGLAAEEVQADRVRVAREHAQRWDAVVVLKGAHTVVASPDGRVRISPFVNPGLASGGTGDVLAGAIVGLAAQGLSPFDAASLGVYLHGLAGEGVRRELGEAGMLAGDLLPELPRAIKSLRE
ncbi:MAG TPA: NAD(P)H-hydrate dehydratase [Dehalococcoidia bacterium]|nr:NAD(P)H-hydrate dehydratase [Dehalococcoidia bacterium]